MCDDPTDDKAAAGNNASDQEAGQPSGVPVKVNVTGNVSIDLNASDVVSRLVKEMGAFLGVMWGPVDRWRQASVSVSEARSRRKIAKIDAEVKRDVAAIEAETDDIRWQRAENRYRAKALREQHNIETTFEKAIPHLKDTAKPEQLRPDFLEEWAEWAGKVSDEQLKEYLGRSLAAETNAPGTIRKKTLQTLGALDPDDIKQFFSVCRFAPDQLPGKAADPVIFNHQDPIYLDNGVTFETLRNLRTLGLVDLTDVGQFSPGSHVSGGINWFGGAKYTMRSTDDRPSRELLKRGIVRFTLVGGQIAQLLADDPSKLAVVEGFPQYLAERFAEQGIEFSGPGITLSKSE